MARRDDGLDEGLIDAIYAAAARPELWPETLRMIQDAFGCVASSFLGQEAGGKIAVGAIQGHEIAAIERWKADFSHLNPWLRPEVGLKRHLPLTDAHLDVDKAAKDRFEQSYYYNEWVRPQGLRHAIGSALDLTDDGFLIVNCWRPASVGAFDAAESRRFEELSRHLARAAKLSFTVARLHIDLAAARAGQGPATAVFVLDAAGGVRDMNEEAVRLVEGGDVLSLRTNRLETARFGDGITLRRLMAKARHEGLVGGRVLGPVFLQRAGGGAALKAELMALPAETCPFPGALRAPMVLLVSDPERERALARGRLPDLADAFDLTPAERRIGAALLEAPNLRQAALMLGIAYETARTQIRSIFAKTGTRSQVELVRLLSRQSG